MMEITAFWPEKVRGETEDIKMKTEYYPQNSIICFTVQKIIAIIFLIDKLQ